MTNIIHVDNIMAHESAHCQQIQVHT